MKNLFMVAIMLALLTGLNACGTIVPGKVVYSDKLTAEIGKMNVKAAILVTADGQILLYDEMGNADRVTECFLPEPDRKSIQSKTTADQSPEAASNQPAKVCQGMTKGSAVTSIRTISILKSNSQNCITFGTDATGHPQQICW